MEVTTTITQKTYTIIDGATDDMELLDALMDIDEGNLSGLRRAIVTLLGEKGRKELYENCRGENGRVSAGKVLAEFKEILNEAPKAVKNS